MDNVELLKVMKSDEFQLKIKKSEAGRRLVLKAFGISEADIAQEDLQLACADLVRLIEEE